MSRSLLSRIRRHLSEDSRPDRYRGRYQSLAERQVWSLGDPPPERLRFRVAKKAVEMLHKNYGRKAKDVISSAEAILHRQYFDIPMEGVGLGNVDVILWYNWDFDNAIDSADEMGIDLNDFYRDEPEHLFGISVARNRSLVVHYFRRSNIHGSSDDFVVDNREGLRIGETMRRDPFAKGMDNYALN